MGKVLSDLFESFTFTVAIAIVAILVAFLTAVMKPVYDAFCRLLWRETIVEKKNLLTRAFSWLFDFREVNQNRPGERMNQLLLQLGTAASEMDDLIESIVADMKKRESAIAKLQENNVTLQNEETELKKKIDSLKDIPIEVADYFKEINENTILALEKRKARRDVFMFILGVMVTVFITIMSASFNLASVIKAIWNR